MTATDTPIATAIERTTMTSSTTAERNPSPFGNDFPEHAPTAVQPGAIGDAFAFTSDRLDRLEHMLDSLNTTVMRAGSVLAPVLTDGTYDDTHALAPSIDCPPAEDRRSTIARRVSGIGERADRLASATIAIERTLESILDATEF